MFLLVLIVPAGWAGAVQVDSLQGTMGISPHTFSGDTVRVMTLVEMGRQVNNERDAIGHLHQTMGIAQKRSWPRGIMIVTCRLGFHYSRMGFDYRACECFFKGLTLAEKLGDPFYMGFSYRYLGDNHNDLGEYKKAVHFLTKSLPYLLKAGDHLRYIGVAGRGKAILRKRK